MENKLNAFSAPLCLLAIFSALVDASPKKAPIRFTQIPNYEDSVRIAVVYNIARGNNPFGGCAFPNPLGIGLGSCPSNTRNVGTVMRDYVVAALDPSDIPNMIVAASDTVTWASVQGWWPGRLPHVIVHLNAGWYTCNGDSIPAVLAKAADSAVGIVSVGDDAAHFSNAFFGFDSVINMWGPQNGGTYATMDLWIELARSSDTLSDPGVVRNASDNLLVQPKLTFKNYAANGRCEADADVYTVGEDFASRITYLGIQKGRQFGVDKSDPDGPATAYNAIVTLQDDQRRAVVFSFQPQYIVEDEAVAQILYDGILYASFAHFYNRKLKRIHIIR